MQIMPSGAAWTNPAAQNQQALGDTKHSASLKNTANAGELVNPLEESGKASDRDANERYDGPLHQSNTSNSSAKDTAVETDSMLSLPANDDIGNTLDLLG
ncbi:MAG TPA: hypothetical protein VM260_24215 [Pirellula sp.]|nr:hypothetical protein [Pirellula sp.]